MPFADCDGLKIYYEASGAGQPILLLNGLMANTASWVFQLPAFLAKGYRVIRMDFSGQGKSDKPHREYNMRQHVGEVAAVLDSLGLERAHLVGTSYGGEVALLCAIHSPKRLSSLVVSNSLSEVNRPLRSRGERWLMATRFRSGRILWQVVHPDIYSDEFIEKHWDFVSKTAPSFDLLDFDVVAEMLKAFMDFNVTSDLDKIEAPTLVIAGELDGLKPLKYAQSIHDGIKNSKLCVIKGAGHVSMWENPGEFNREVLSFLETIPA